MDRIEHQEQVDVFEVVESMRSDRCNMVQAKVRLRLWFLSTDFVRSYTTVDHLFRRGLKHFWMSVLKTATKFSFLMQ